MKRKLMCLRICTFDPWALQHFDYPGDEKPSQHLTVDARQIMIVMYARENEPVHFPFECVDALRGCCGHLPSCHVRIQGRKGCLRGLNGAVREGAKGVR